MTKWPLKRGDHGQRVKNLQWLLHHNRFGDFGGGQVDGSFGVKTGRAVWRCKYRCGYALRNVNARYGPGLHDLLLGIEHLTPRQKTRRNRRLKLIHLAQLRAFRGKAYDLALGQVGYVEGAGNRTTFGAWYGLDGEPWCAMFLSWCFSHAGRAMRYAAVISIYDDALNLRGGLERTTTPIRGDLAILFSATEHVGMFDHWVDQSRGIFATIEGNTSPNGSQTNGGMVQHKTRYTSQVVIFVRVNRES